MMNSFSLVAVPGTLVRGGDVHHQQQVRDPDLQPPGQERLQGHGGQGVRGGSGRRD